LISSCAAGDASALELEAGEFDYVDSTASAWPDERGFPPAQSS
jgi:hypothetical protein